MNIKIPYHWLLEYLDTKATPEQIARYLSLCGPSIEKIETIEDEPVFDIEVTTNRVDCMSIMGIAREAAAILPQFGINASFRPYVPAKIPQVSQPVDFTIQNNSKLCKRIMAMVFELKIGPSANLFQKRLTQAGLRPLLNAVDVTNYVMTEIGHPTHVFDYDLIQTKKFLIRESKKGEKAISFENKKYTLIGGDIVIDDGTGQIIDLPGIIGTKNSVVNNQTKRVVFFLETNDPVRIRRSSMTYGIRTVAATLNEKGVDPQLAEIAFNRGVKIFIDKLKAKPISSLIDIYPDKPKKTIITVQHRWLKEKIGAPVSGPQVIQMLKSLGFKPQVAKNRYTILVPSWRINDINIKEDIVEEVARIYGYHRIPSILPPATNEISQINQEFYWEQKLKELFCCSGFCEIYTYSLVSKKMLLQAGLKPANHLKLKNPLSEEWQYLRRNLMPSLLTSYRENETRADKLAFYELANIYLPRKGLLPEELLTLGLIANYSLPDTKEQLKLIFAKIGLPLDFKKDAVSSYIKPGWVISLRGKTIGFLGQLKTEIKQTFAITGPVAIGELTLGRLLAQAGTRYRYQPIPKYNHIIEDLTFILPANISIDQLLKDIAVINPAINQVIFKTKYVHNVTVSIYYLDRKQQLTTKDISPIRQKIVDKLACQGIKLVGQL